MWYCDNYYINYELGTYNMTKFEDLSGFLKTIVILGFLATIKVLFGGG